MITLAWLFQCFSCLMWLKNFKWYVVEWYWEFMLDCSYNNLIFPLFLGQYFFILISFCPSESLFIYLFFKDESSPSIHLKYIITCFCLMAQHVVHFYKCSLCLWKTCAFYSCWVQCPVSLIKFTVLLSS